MKLDSLPVSIPETASQLPVKENTDHPHHKKRESALMVFGTTFVTIFLAEIGDKTQLSTLLMSAESHAPWVVFLGSGTALVTTSLLGVLLGGFIASKLSPKTVEKSAGVMLLLISVMLFWDVFVG
ncbi:TMEM165/GDT1 family protein [Sphaerospermopsis aphanizomenoides BCCUSP55]|uniref:TMEM165/GDT1 family protein n=1 Tax=Sphaerospermopsis aphanizomenoides TaxID=459663 RepID=UPI000B238262|nr:TMEM165/GDT1 family protein [Sphaerospermopsis aphanizomenoides]MBK1989295.1 TMEM165/GDT1 family protein [Sphaerospermopsis aphanizomenoides BCCUSP55]